MFIFHGDNQSATRKYFSEMKASLSGKKQIVELDGSAVTLAELVNYIRSASLLGSTNAVFIEGFFSRRPGNEKQKILTFLGSNTKDDIYLWEDRDVSSQLASFPQGVSRKIDLPKFLYQYLDNFSLDLLQSSLANASPEQIFSLLVRQVRRLLQVKSQTGNFPSWQLTKLTRLSEKYSHSALLNMYSNLLEIDYLQKTSQSPYDLSAALVFWTVRAVK